MAFPVSPVNGQRTIVNGITYTFNSGTNSWTRVANSGLTTNPSVYLGNQTVTTAVTLIDTMPIAGNTYFRWTITSIDNVNNNFASTLYDTINDGTNVYAAQTGTLQSNPTAAVAAFSSNISGGNINLYATGDSNNVTVSYERVILGSNTVSGYLNAGPQGAQGATGSPGTVNATTGAITTSNFTPATSTTTGALQVAGGAGIVGNIYAGGSAYAATVTATNGIEMNSTSIAASTAIPGNTNARTLGPINQLPGVIVTQAPGSRWVIQ